jgi:pimeloyl-ACP methyl ester carboxylesterase
MDKACSRLPRFKTDAGRERYLAAYDSALRDWPVPYRELDVQTRLGPTHLITSGPPDAPALLLLPSFAATATVWRPNIAALSRRYCTYAIDVIGQPGKSSSTRRLRSQRDYARWLVDVLDGLGIARASVIGCSFGGFLALNQALLTPERVERAVLIGPAGVFVGISWKVVLAMRTSRLRRRIRRFLGDTRTPDITTLQGPGAPVHPADAGWRALMAVTMAESPKVSVTSPKVFTRAELSRIKAPTLLLIGEHERAYAPEATLHLALQRMPGLKGAIIKGADHIAAMAQPEEVNARIVRFLERGEQ